MWKFALMFTLLFFPVLSIQSPVVSLPSMMEASPPYAKWGRVAMQETIAKYPNAHIVDYLHVGRKKDNSTTTEEFKLWLNQGNKEFGVFIDIRFDTETEEVISIHFEETNR